jgi:kynureninase
LKELREEYEVKIKQLESERDRYWKAIKHALDRPREVKLITAGPGAIVATDGSTINIQQHIHHALQLQRAIARRAGEK